MNDSNPSLIHLIGSSQLTGDVEEYDTIISNYQNLNTLAGEISISTENDIIEFSLSLKYTNGLQLYSNNSHVISKQLNSPYMSIVCL